MPGWDRAGRQAAEKAEPPAAAGGKRGGEETENSHPPLSPTRLCFSCFVFMPLRLPFTDKTMFVVSEIQKAFLHCGV